MHNLELTLVEARSTIALSYLLSGFASWPSAWRCHIRDLLAEVERGQRELSKGCVKGSWPGWKCEESSGRKAHSTSAWCKSASWTCGLNVAVVVHQYWFWAHIFRTVCQESILVGKGLYFHWVFNSCCGAYLTVLVICLLLVPSCRTGCILNDDEASVSLLWKGREI